MTVYKMLLRLAGRLTGNKVKFWQVVDTNACAKKFYAFTPLGADAVVAAIVYATDGTSAMDSLGTGGNVYQGITYFGDFSSITLTSGKVILYLDE